MQNIFTKLLCFCLLIFTIQAATAQCIEDSHSPFEEQGWLSCVERANPNNFRANSHWLHYDLGYQYPVKSFYFWNHNVWGETTMGVKEVAVDYSIDNVTWIPLDTFQIEKAPGSWKYTGIEASAFEEVTGRYFLFTVLETWDGLNACAGMGEIKFGLGEVVSSTEDPELEAGFSINPNPASDVVNIILEKDIEADIIYLYSAMGQKLAELLPKQNLDLQFEVASLNDGMYFISVLREGNISTRSFIKME